MATGMSVGGFQRALARHLGPLSLSFYSGVEFSHWCIITAFEIEQSEVGAVEPLARVSVKWKCWCFCSGQPVHPGDLGLLGRAEGPSVLSQGPAGVSVAEVRSVWDRPWMVTVWGFLHRISVAETLTPQELAGKWADAEKKGSRVFCLPRGAFCLSLS